MVTLPILPDEFVFGYFGRLLWSLGIEPGESDFSKAVQYRLGSRERPCTKEESIGLLAARAGSDLATITQRHTVAPAYLAFCATEGETYFDIGTRRFGRNVLGPRSAAARFCPKCAEEDLAFWRCSYWRRSHQLPGLSHCHKHHLALSYAKDPLAVQFQPHHFLHDEDHPSQKGTPCQVEQKMAVIWEGLIDHGQPIGFLRAVELLDRVRVVNGKPTVCGFGLEKRMQAAVSEKWIKTHISQDSCLKVLSRHHQAKSADYVFALAMLYEDPDQVVTLLTAKQTTSPERPKPCQPREKIDPAVATALEAFRCGLPLTEVLAMQSTDQKKAFERRLRELAQAEKFA